MCYNAPDEINDLYPTIFKDREAILDFVDKFERDTEDYVFEDLLIIGTMPPEDLSDTYMDERNQRIIARQAKPFGADADDVTNIVVTFEADGQTWIFCPQAVRYNGRWYIESLQGNLAILLKIRPYAGGIAQFSLEEND